MAQTTIFSIDFQQNPYRMNVFMNYIASQAHNMRGNVVTAIGKYEDVLEHCFICRSDDFDNFFRDTVFLECQESVLHVASGNKMEAHLEYLRGSMSEPPGTRTSLGCMHEVCEAEALTSTAWTYRPDMDTYWVAKRGNPDGSLFISQARYADTTIVDRLVLPEGIAEK